MGLSIIAVIASVCAASLRAPAMESPKQAPLASVSSVDLKRYVGKWYEIARYPNRFQRACASDTTAEYDLKPNGKVGVVNTCRKSDGSAKKASGTAKVVDPSNARLKVSFFWPFYGDYWIIGLDPEYRWAVMGEPDRKYLWILSRTPHMPETDYQRTIEQARAAGYDPQRLIKTPQSVSVK
jgi:apolipoprotein D and lipocalin family protein